MNSNDICLPLLLRCYARNEVGEAERACVFELIPAGDLRLPSAPATHVSSNLVKDVEEGGWVLGGDALVGTELLAKLLLVEPRRCVFDTEVDDGRFVRFIHRARTYGSWVG